jgi:hypothetical protein
MTEVGRFEKYDKFFGAVINSALIYLFYRIIVTIFCVGESILVNINNSQIQITNISLINISIIAAITIIYTAILILFYEKDLILKLANKIGISNKLSGNVWERALKDNKDKWIRVFMSDDFFIQGYLKYFSTRGEKQCIFIGDPRYIRRNSKTGENEIVKAVDESSEYVDGVIILDEIKRIEISEFEKRAEYGENEGDMKEHKE